MTSTDEQQGEALSETATAKAQESLWRHSDFIKLWAAQAISAFGSRITRDGLPWAALLLLRATPFQMALLGAAGATPALLVGLLAGVWVDRRRRRPLMMAADLLRAVVLLTVPLAAFAGALSIEQLYLVAALSGGLTVLFNVADQSYLPTLVPRSKLMEGNSKLATTGSIAELGGPALAGGLIQLLTAPVAIGFDALSFLWSALWLGLIRQPEPPSPPVEHRHTLWIDIKLGFELLFSNSVLRALAISSAIWYFFGGFFGALYLAFMNYELGISPGVLGLLVAVGGLGALLGALAVGRVNRRIGVGRAMILGLGLSSFVLFLLPIAPGYSFLAIAAVFITQIVADFAAEFYFINEVTLRQSLLPINGMGRANAAMQFLGGTGLAGMLLAGVLAELIGMRLTVALGTAGMVASAVWLFFSPVRRVRDLPGEADVSPAQYQGY